MTRTAPFLATAVLVAAAAARAGPEKPTAWDVTERDRGLKRAVTLACGKKAKSVLFLIDASPSLSRTDFQAAFAAAQKELGFERIGVLEMDGRRAVFGKKAVPALRDMLSRPSAYIRNVYASVRAALSELKKRPGPRVLVVVTMDNGDLEDENGVERTAMLVRRAKATCSVIAREVAVADNYGRRYLGDPPRDTVWAGPAAAFTEFPQRFLLQLHPNEYASSGFAAWGLTRLAAATGGRVYLSNLPGEGHKCTGGGLNCLLCAGDHAPTDRHFLPGLLRALAPSVVSRRDVLKAAGRDPFLAATLRVWEQGAKDGIFSYGPALRSEGRVLKHVRRREGPDTPLEFDRRFEQDARRADRLVQSCTKLIEELDAVFTKERGGAYRYRANADVTRAMLRLTRLNLKLYAHWCRKVAPVLVARRSRDVPAPEVGYDFDGTERLEGSVMYYLGLCHGIAPLRRLKLPGRKALAADFDEFEREFARITKTYAHTPYAEVLRKGAIIWPHLAVRGTEDDPPRGNVGSEKDDTTTRPTRKPAPTVGSDTGGGATSGGG